MSKLCLRLVFQFLFSPYLCYIKKALGEWNQLELQANEVILKIARFSPDEKEMLLEVEVIGGESSSMVELVLSRDEFSRYVGYWGERGYKIAIHTPVDLLEEE